MPRGASWYRCSTCLSRTKPVNAKNPEAPPYPPDDLPKRRAKIPMPIALIRFYGPFADRSLPRGVELVLATFSGAGRGDHTRGSGLLQLAGTL
jgi:hypothetical protein